MSWVPAEDTTRRLRSLTRLGFPAVYMSEELGVYVGTVERHIRGERENIPADLAAKVTEMFDRLKGTRSDSKVLRTRYATRARTMAIQNGWPPPRYWNSTSAKWSKGARKCVATARCRRVGIPTNGDMCKTHYESARLQKAKVEGYAPGLIPADEVKAHVRRLIASGMSERRIGRLAGLGENTVRTLLDRDFVQSSTAAKLFALEPGMGVTKGETGWVAAVGTTRRAQALMAIGYGIIEIAAACESDVRWVSDVISGRKVYVRPGHAARMMRAYEELRDTPAPPSKTASRSRNRAQKEGWLTPAGWDDDDLDDLSITPAGDRDPSFEERYVELRDQVGLSDERIARRMDVKFGSLRRKLERHGIPVSDELRSLAQKERTAKEAA